MSVVILFTNSIPIGIPNLLCMFLNQLLEKEYEKKVVIPKTVNRSKTPNLFRKNWTNFVFMMRSKSMILERFRKTKLVSIQHLYTFGIYL